MVSTKKISAYHKLENQKNFCVKAVVPIVGIGTALPAGVLDVSPLASTTGAGQGIRLVAQDALQSGATSYNGGSVYIKGGRGYVYGTSNDVTLGGGDSSAGGAGATLVLGGAPYQTAGTATLTGGTGWNGQGNVTIQGGATTPTGFVLLQPSAGNVGIGTTNPVSQLHVSAGTPAIRIEGTNAGQPSTLRFDGLDGGSVYRGSWISFNPVAGTNQSYFAFSNGSTDLLNVRMDGNVGIGTTSPGGKLDVNQTTAGSIALQGQNAGTAFWKVLNPAGGATNTWNAANAIEYVGKDTVTNRSINAAGTVNASGADFAEWVDWTGGAKPEMGSVILYRGSYVVVSSPFTAAFIGNDIKDPDHAILVAFAGQLPVLIHGQVHEGDLIVASDDGTARAVAKADVTLAMAQKAVGTAWASSNDPGLKRVNVAVGIGLGGGGGARDISFLKDENEKLKQENAAIKAYLCSKDKKAPICK